jgi:hypothetical protein
MAKNSLIYLTSAQVLINCIRKDYQTCLQKQTFAKSLNLKILSEMPESALPWLLNTF